MFASTSMSQEQSQSVVDSSVSGSPAIQLSQEPTEPNVDSIAAPVPVSAPAASTSAAASDSPTASNKLAGVEVESPVEPKRAAHKLHIWEEERDPDHIDDRFDHSQCRLGLRVVEAGSWCVVAT